MISSNKWGARKLSYATYFENLKSWGDYNKVIGAKSGIGSILKFLCLTVEIIRKNKEKCLLVKN